MFSDQLYCVVKNVVFLKKKWLGTKVSSYYPISGYYLASDNFLLTGTLWDAICYPGKRYSPHPLKITYGENFPFFRVYQFGMDTENLKWLYMTHIRYRLTTQKYFKKFPKFHLWYSPWYLESIFVA